VGLGLVCFAVGGVAMALSPARVQLVAAPAMAGYAFLIVGAYRVFFGRGPKAESPLEVSLTRVIFGVLSVLFVVSTILGLAELIDFLFIRQ